MSPILFRLGSLSVYAYGFFLALGFVVGLILAVLKTQKEGVPFEHVANLFFYTVLSAILGSRLLFILVNVDLYRQNPLQMFKIWEGGLVFYGGLILAVAVSIGYMRWHRLPLWNFADLFSPSIAIGLFFGRLGCFFAGCCYGKETSLPWGVVFTDPNSLAPLHVLLHPVQLYEAGGNLALFFFLKWREKKKAFDGQIFWLLILLYAMIRFFVEMVRGDPRGSFFYGLLSTSQGIGIFLGILSLFMLFYLRKKQRG